MADIIVNVMTVEEATRCVAKIKSGIDDVRLLVLDLYERQGWIPLGYTNWRECVEAEFRQSQRHLYRLLEAAQVERAICPIGQNAIPESQARELAPLMRQDEAEMVDTWHELQEQYGDKITAAKIKEVVSQKLNKDERRSEQAGIVDLIKAQPVNNITGLYDVVVIDPPWPMEKIEREVAPNQVGFDYPTMTLEEIGNLTIPCADDCHIWLWTTHKFLPAALDLLAAWDMKYVCTFVWHKPGGFQPFGLPQYNCEFILYARRGAPKFVDLKAFPVCFDAPRGAHSEKPGEFYDVIKRVSAGRRLDMFARKPREGFDIWGNEA